MQSLLPPHNAVGRRCGQWIKCTLGWLFYPLQGRIWVKDGKRHPRDPGYQEVRKYYTPRLHYFFAVFNNNIILAYPKQHPDILTYNPLFKTSPSYRAILISQGGFF